MRTPGTPNRSADERIEALKRSIRAIEKKKREEDRRRETHQKVLLGAAMIALARNEPSLPASMVGVLSATLSEKDRETVAPLFASWQEAAASNRDSDF